MLQTVRSNAAGARPLGERELHPEIPLPGRNDAGLFSPGTLPRAGHPLPDDIAHAPAAAVSLGLPVCVSCAGRSHWLRGDSLTRGRQCALSIEAVLDGEGELVAGRRRYALHPGDVFILRPGERHVCRAVSRAPFRKAFIRLAVLSRLQRDVLDGFAVLRSTRLSPSAHHMARVNAALDAIHAALRDAPWTCHNEV
ncbi:hypothetical protein GX586_11630, partial [bacterium]|nr:hypothetical protein [bacterium]